MIIGSEASLSFTRKGVLVTFEPTPSPIAAYGLNGWPKALREQYLASMGVTGGQRPSVPPTKPPQEVPVEQGLSHNEWFIKALRENLPSPESAEEGHNAATAAHMGNLAFRRGKKIRYDAASFQAIES